MPVAKNPLHTEKKKLHSNCAKGVCGSHRQDNRNKDSGQCVCVCVSLSLSPHARALAWLSHLFQPSHLPFHHRLFVCVCACTFRNVRAASNKGGRELPVEKLNTHASSLIDFFPCRSLFRVCLCAVGVCVCVCVCVCVSLARSLACL